MPYKYNPLLSGKLDKVGADRLGDLGDVDAGSAIDGKGIVWNAATSKWVPEEADFLLLEGVSGTSGNGGDMYKSTYDTNDDGVVDNSERLEGETLATVQAHGVDAGTITQGTIGLARVPAMDDAHIPNLDTLSGGAFGTAQIPSIGAYKITSGTLGVARHETLDNLNGTVALSQIPTMDDAHIPDLDTLSYSAAFGTAQVPSLGAYKIASGTLNADRIPALPTARITTGTFNAERIPILPTDRYGSAVLVSGTRSMTGDLDFAKHQAKAMAFERLGSAPASPATAQMYYNTSNGTLYMYA